MSQSSPFHIANILLLVTPILSKSNDLIFFKVIIITSITFITRKFLCFIVLLFLSLYLMKWANTSALTILSLSLFCLFFPAHCWINFFKSFHVFSLFLLVFCRYIFFCIVFHTFCLFVFILQISSDIDF